MNFVLPFSPATSAMKISHPERIMLVGSCFTENIGAKMASVKMNVLWNPRGISFNPMSIADSVQACLARKQYQGNDLCLLNELWNSWDFHSSFSGIDKALTLQQMNESLSRGAKFLDKSAWLIISFGSAYQYFLKRDDNEAIGVANCHKAPGSWFEKRLLSVGNIVGRWKELIEDLRAKNPLLNIVFTVSPVKHLKDGIVENSRSKAILIEAVGQLAQSFDNCGYFPAYELVNDVLRDYRFYEKDMAHPNEQAIQYIWEQFVSIYVDEKSHTLMKGIMEIHTAAAHKSRFPGTLANQKFRSAHLKKIEALKVSFPYINWEEELTSFSAE